MFSAWKHRRAFVASRQQIIPPPTIWVPGNTRADQGPVRCELATAASGTVGTVTPRHEEPRRPSSQPQPTSHAVDAKRRRKRQDKRDATEAARAARQSELRRLLNREPKVAQFLRWIGHESPDEIRHRVEMWVNSPTATHLVEEALRDYQQYGNIAWLDKKFKMQEESPPPAIAVPHRLRPHSGDCSMDPAANVSPVFETALQLPTDELVTVANALLREAEMRKHREAEARLAARSEALEQLSKLTQIAEETKRRIEDEVVRSKRHGATWAAIGSACNVGRDVAYKRWSGLVAEQSDQDD